MLRKVRPRAHEHPVSYMLHPRNIPRDYRQRPGTLAQSFPLHPFLPQMRVPHSPHPGVPTPSPMLVAPGVALAGSWCPWAEGRGL